MKKNIIVDLLGILILLLAFSGCRTANAPRYKSYVMEEKFVNIKGLNIPVLTPERKMLIPSKELKRDMKNSLPINSVDAVYGTDGYREAIKHHLIKSTAVNIKAYSYNEVNYDETYSRPNTKHDIREYSYTYDDVLEYVGETNMQVIPLKEKTFTGDTTYSEYISEVLVTYSCTFNYYPNGKLRHYICNIHSARAGTKSVLFYMSIGTEYNFDESGNLLMAMNYEEGFKMDFSTLLTITLKGRNEILDKYAKTIGEGVKTLDVLRNKNEFGSFWIIPYKIGLSKLVYRIIDDETGEIKDEILNDEQALKKYTVKSEEYTRKVKELRKSF